MTKFELPVSTGQAVVGAIIGWNIFVGIDTETTVLFNILMTWVLCPILSAVIAVILYQIVKWFLNTIKLHILTLDWVSRTALIVAGAFGSYSLGANNIANVMGVFINAITLDDLTLGNITFNTAQQLFFVGALAIAIGIFTYSKRVMLTVGNSMMPLTPITAGIVVMAHSIVLFLFASEGLEYALASRGLPTITGSRLKLASSGWCDHWHRATQRRPRTRLESARKNRHRLGHHPANRDGIKYLSSILFAERV